MKPFSSEKALHGSVYVLYELNHTLKLILVDPCDRNDNHGYIIRS